MTAPPCINPSLIRQYLYCPAAAYYIIAGLAEPPTERMKKAKKHRKRPSKPWRRPSAQRPWST